MLTEYGEAYKIPDGLLADAKSGSPSSIIKFMILMGLGAILSIFVMNKRKNELIAKTYSKLTIFQKKN